MPHFHWVKRPNKVGKDGQEIPTGGEMIQVQDEVAPEQVNVGQPVAVNKPERAARVRKFYCIACDKPMAFGTAGVMSIHFKRVHSDLWEDKNSFRDHLDVREG